MNWLLPQLKLVKISREDTPMFFYDQFKSTRGKIRHILHADLAVSLPIK